MIDVNRATRHREVIERLSKLTAEGKIRWESSGKGEFTCAVRSSAFSLGDFGGQLQLVVYDPSGEAEETISRHTIDLGTADSARQGDEALRDLYDRVRRQALGLDALLESALKDLASVA